MTNLQNNSQALSPQLLRRLWFGAPIAALSVVALILAASVLAPMWQALQRDSQRLKELEELETQVSLMRNQLRAQDIQQEKALEQKDKLFRLIAGSGDVSTMLAVLDREAKLTGVRLDLYEPQAAPAPPPPQGSAPPAPPAANQPQAAAPNPLQAAGLQPQAMVISVKGTYPQLLAFLRRLESLNVLVIQSDLKLEAPTASADRTRPGPQDVTMKLSLTLYGKPPQAAGPNAAAAGASAPGQAGGSGSAPTPGAPAAAGTAPATPPTGR
ncbi:MAG: hypothetical protein ACKO0M_06205 [Cyanobium sp.]